VSGGGPPLKFHETRDNLILNKDMSLCTSLSGRPSNIGTRFHNYLYDEIGLNFIYKFVLHR
jgi:hypothetical protein